MTEGPVYIPVPLVHTRVLFSDGRTIDFVGHVLRSGGKAELAHAIETGSGKDVKIVGTAVIGTPGAITPVPEKWDPPETPDAPSLFEGAA